MAKPSRSGRTFSAPSVIEPLEGRLLLSAGHAAHSSVAAAVRHTARAALHASAAVAGPQLSLGTNLAAFNSVATGNSGAGPSPVQSIAITNTGSAALTISGATIVADPASSTNDASAFSIVAGPPTTLAAGQTSAIQVRFTAARVGIASALLQVQSNDPTTPTATVNLRGLGTAGQFANLEPSFQRILDLYKIPDNVGDPTPDTTDYPNVPTLLGDEVEAQQFVKAGAGPVSVQLLASFGIGSPVVSRLGYYAAGSPAARTELLALSDADQQTVDPTPMGATQFDPGDAAFGLYASFPHFTDPALNGELLPHPRYSYSENVFNTTWDTGDPRKMRAFPLKNPDGSVVANAYVVAFEDYNQSYDSNDLVAIVRNVKPLTGPVLGVENMDEAPAPDRMIFNRINVLDTTSTAGTGDIVHDTGVLRIHNTGDQPLKISALALSDPSAWRIVNPPSLPATVAANGGTLDLTIKFIATQNPNHGDNQTNDTATTNGISPIQAGGVYNDQLTIISNDATNASRTVQLAGYWQYQSAHENEPGLQTLINKLAGYATEISSTPVADLIEGATPNTYGEEYVAPTQQGLWAVADASQPVAVRQIASFHNQGNTARTSWYSAGSSTLNTLYQTVLNEGQSLFPHIQNTNNTTIATFTPSTAFGFNLDGESSEDSKNTVDINTYGRSGHAVRFYPLRDASGQLVANTWLMVQDYQDTQFDNDDFQDLVYIVSNMRPAAAPATPADFQAATAGTGVLLQWSPGDFSTSSSSVSYNVYRSINGGATQKLGSTAQLSWTDAAPPAGAKSIKYYVSAVNNTGQESPLANATPGGSSSGVSNSGLTVTIGAGTAFKQLRFTDADGTLATLAWNGPGSASITFTGSNVAQSGTKGLMTITGSGLAITAITATGSTAGTSLTINTNGRGNKAIDVGTIATDGAFKAINAKTTNLIGSLTAVGSIAHLSLASAAGGGGTISLGSGAPVVLQIGSVTGDSIISAAPITSISATQWAGAAAGSAGPTISAPSIGRVTVSKDASFTLSAAQIAAMTVRGALHDSTLTLTAALAPKSYALGALTAGSISNVTLNSTGNIRSINAGSSMARSRIYAGIGTLGAGQTLPNTASDFVSQASIGSFRVRHSATPTFSNSEIAATSLGHLDLGTASFANGGNKFGVAGRSISTLAVVDSGTKKRLTVKNATDANTLAAQIAAEGANLQDLIVKVI